MPDNFLNLTDFFTLVLSAQ